MMRATESEKISSTAMINLVSYVADSAHICRNGTKRKKRNLRLIEDSTWFLSILGVMSEEVLNQHKLWERVEFDVSWLYMLGLPTWLFSVLVRNHVVNTNVSLHAFPININYNFYYEYQ